MLAALVRVLHVAIVVAFFYFPFSGDDTMLLLHAIAVPGMVFHWWMNNDTCALTLLEQYLTGKDKGETFFDMLFGSIYRIPGWIQTGPVPYLLAIGLWLYSVWQIRRRRVLQRLWADLKQLRSGR